MISDNININYKQKTCESSSIRLIYVKLSENMKNLIDLQLNRKHSFSSSFAFLHDCISTLWLGVIFYFDVAKSKE